MDTNRILERILKIENPILTPSGRLDIPPRIPRCTNGCKGCFNSFMARISPYKVNDNNDIEDCSYYDSPLFISTGRKWRHLEKPIDELSEDEYLELLGLILSYYE